MRTPLGRLPWIAALGAAAVIGAIAWRMTTQKVKRASVPRSVLSAGQKARIMEREVNGLQAHVTSNPQDVRARLALASLDNALGHSDQAIRQLQEITKLRPNDPNAQLALANACLLAKQYDQAVQTSYAICRRWPKNASAWQSLAAALFHEQRFREAAEVAQQAANLEPANPNDRFIMAASLVEDSTAYPDPQLKAPELNRAVKELTALTKVWPGVGDLYLRLGRAYMALHNRNGAVANMRRAAELFPDRTDVSMLLAKAYVSSGDRQAALQTVKTALARHPDNADLNDSLGQLLQTSGEPDADRSALAAFQKAVQINPRNGRFLERLGTAYVRVNDLQQARQTFEAAIAFEPNRAFPYQQLSSVYARLGDAKRSAEAERTATAMAFNSDQLKHLQAQADSQPRNVALHLALADRFRNLGLSSPARDEYIAVLKLDRNNRRAQDALVSMAK